MTTGTPDADAARAELVRLQRLRGMIRLAGLLCLLLFGLVGFVLAVVSRVPVVGFLVMGLGIFGRLVAGASDTYFSVRMPQLSYEADGSQRWWYDPRSGNVEEGMMPRGRHRDGPYRTREDALRAPEIARERAAAWNAEDD